MEMDERYEKAALENSIAMAKVVEKMAQINETVSGLSKDSKLMRNLRDSHSIISQVLQSLEDEKAGRGY